MQGRQLRSIYFSSNLLFRLTSPPALLPIGHVSIHDVPPNSVLCQLVGLVRACRPKCRVVHCFFFLRRLKTWRVRLFTHKFWRGGPFSCLGAPMCFWRKNSNFAETPSLVHSVPTFNVKLISTHDLTFAPKCAQLPQVSIPSQSPHLSQHSCRRSPLVRPWTSNQTRSH